MTLDKDKCRQISELLRVAARFYNTAAIGIEHDAARPLHDLKDAADSFATLFGSASDAEIHILDRKALEDGR